MDININKRAEVLEYSLHIEESVDLLLLLCLGITDKSRTKLFGNKAGISFQNKIDLLYDIDVLSKEDQQGLELQMNFRNKFLHDINCNTYITVLSRLDNGIKNRFEKYLLEGGETSDETACKEAYQKLCLSNLKIILNRMEMKRASAEDTMDLLTTPTKLFTNYIDSYFDLVKDLYQQLSESELENKKVENLANNIRLTCKEHVLKFTNNNEIMGVNYDYYTRLSSSDKMKEIFK